jgi:hypothetical protein
MLLFLRVDLRRLLSNRAMEGSMARFESARRRSPKLSHASSSTIIFHRVPRAATVLPHSVFLEEKSLREKGALPQ